MTCVAVKNLLLKHPHNTRIMIIMLNAIKFLSCENNPFLENAFNYIPSLLLCAQNAFTTGKFRKISMNTFSCEKCSSYCSSDILVRFIKCQNAHSALHKSKVLYPSSLCIVNGRRCHKERRKKGA